MDEATLRERWQETLGPDTLIESIQPGRSYRPILMASRKREDADAGYLELEQLGAGGMGVVVRARQHKLARDVALKRLLPGGQRELFLAEALLTGRLEHPGIVPIYDLGAGSQPFLAMRLVDGRSWHAALADQAAEQAIETLIQVCNAVAFAHSRGVVHNDIKPANVMLGEFGEVLLLDWGLAVEFCDDAADAKVRHKSAITSPCGTPSYMPPELALGDGRAIGPGTDVFMLGATLVEVLTGSPPRQGRKILQVLIDAVDGKPPDLRAVPAPLRALCARALSNAPEERGSVAAFQQELQDYLRHAQSRRMAQDAADTLASCLQQAGEAPADGRSLIYESFAEAVAGFRGAMKIWPANPVAHAGVEDARRGLAEAALRHGDLRLAEDQLARIQGEAATPLRAAVQTARLRQRQARTARRRLRGGLIGAVAMIFLVLTVAVSWLLSLNADLQESNRIRTEQFTVARRNLNVLTSEVRERLLYDAADARSRRAAERVLAEALAGWQELAALGTDDAASRVGEAEVFLRIGELRFLLKKDLDGAERDLRHTLRLLQGSQASRGFMLASEANRLLCEVLAAQGRPAQSLELAYRFLELLQTRLAHNQDNRPLQFILASHAGVIAQIEYTQGDYPRAQEQYETAIGLLSELAVPPSVEQDLANMLLGLAETQLELGEPAAAQQRLTQAERLLATIAPETASVVILNLVAAVNEKLADVAWLQHRPEEALQRQLAVVTQRERFFDRDPDSPLQLVALIGAKLGLAKLQNARAELAAGAVFDEAVQLAERGLRSFPGNMETALLLAEALRNQAVWRLNQKQLSAARESCERAAALLEQTPGSDRRRLELEVATALTLAQCERLQGALSRASAALQQAQQRSGSLAADSIWRVEILREQAEQRREGGDLQGAIAVGETAVALVRQGVAAELEPLLMRLATHLAAADERERALEVLDELDARLQRARAAPPIPIESTDWQNQSWTQRALILQQEGETAAALALVERAIAAAALPPEQASGVQQSQQAGRHAIAARLRMLRGDAQAAKEHLDHGLALYARLPDTETTRARLHELRGEINFGLGEPYLEDFKRALALDPSLPDAAFWCGYLELLAGDARTAADHLTIALQGGRPVTLYRGIAWAMLGERAAAAEDFAACPEEEAAWAALWLAGLGDDSLLAAAPSTGWPGPVLRYARGELGRAELLAEAAALGDAEHAQALGCVGMLAEARGDGALAVEAYQDCLGIGGGDTMQHVWARLRLAALALDPD